ncbi:MAG TPA: hypothetical protein H9750_00635 [Candidatus Mediterraneibacter excrementavium]|nr:hypothetical protein [Candidatus Mediterraneibacter excrementavium]
MTQKYVCRLVCRYIFLGQKYTAHADSEMSEAESSCAWRKRPGDDRSIRRTPTAR